MAFKILMTGRNRKIIAEDISKHIEDEIGCETLGCQPLKSELMHGVFTERPRVIIILLNGESPSEMLIAPNWCGERDRIIATVEKLLEKS